jgi:murein L,D-transpeptidase YcbB/YkuD
VVAAGVLCTGTSLHLAGKLDLPANLAVPAALNDLVRAEPTPAEVALRKKLSELGGRSSPGVGSAEELAAVAAFYNARSGLLWVTEEGLSDRGVAAVSEIRRADDWGLRARDFALPQALVGTVSPEAAAAAELAVTFAVLKYARHARGGRLGDLAGISKVVDYKPPLRKPGEVLAEIAASSEPDAYLRSLHPRHEQFQALRRMLLKARTEQGREGADRLIRQARIVINMERWRWLPPDLGDFHVWNNVPEFVTRVVRKGEVAYTDKIVAGQPEWATPVFSADMKTIVFNPSWGVPDGIRRKELWPRLRETSQGGGLLDLFTGTKSAKSLLDRLKLQVSYQGKPIDPDKVDWASVNIGAYEFRQPPGPANPLGRLKFMFPNKHDVYMHDTTATERDLFGRSYRGLSHGCMRVSDPRRFAVILLAQDKGWSEAEVDGHLSGGTTREVRLTTRIPVHMTYFTAMVDREGTLQTFPDLYGLDTRMGALLFGSKVPFVTPRYTEEIKAMQNRNRPTAAAGTSLADAIASIFSP